MDSIPRNALKQNGSGTKDINGKCFIPRIYYGRPRQRQQLI